MNKLKVMSNLKRSTRRRMYSNKKVRKLKQQKKKSIKITFMAVKRKKNVKIMGKKKNMNRKNFKTSFRKQTLAKILSNKSITINETNKYK